MSDRMQTVQGRCPACGWTSLFLGDGGHVTCSRLECPRPDLVTELIGEIADARQHAAFTFCGQLVGHVTVAEFARKISEKRNALGQREEAVRYANQQKQRAEQAEDLLCIAHDTSNKSEAERAHAVQRAERAEAAVSRIQDAVALHRKGLLSAAELHAVIDAARDQPAAGPAATQATDEEH